MTIGVNSFPVVSVKIHQFTISPLKCLGGGRYSGVWLKLASTSYLSAWDINLLLKFLWQALLHGRIWIHCMQGLIKYVWARRLIIGWRHEGRVRYNARGQPDENSIVYEIFPWLQADFLPEYGGVFANFSNLGGCSPSPLSHTPMAVGNEYCSSEYIAKRFSMRQGWANL